MINATNLSEQTKVELSVHKASDKSHTKPSVGAIIGGVALGGVVKGAVSLPIQIISPKIMKQMQKIGNNLSQDEFKVVVDAAEKAFNNSGLAKKGVEIIKANGENADEVAKIMAQEFNGNFIMKRLPNSIKDFLGSIIGGMVSNGENAFYATQSKKVVLSGEKTLSLASFHELGHATNANLSKIGKVLQKSRSLQMLALPIALIALFKTKKQECQEPKGAVDKATTFVKNNAGKLTFATFIPMLLEEGMATLKGNAHAKKLLSPDLAKKVFKSNALGFATYLGMATLTSLGIFAGVKVKDAITDNNIAKKNAKATQAT